VIRHAAILGGLVLATPALAQEGEIVVTGRGLEAPPGDAAYATTEIDRERLTSTASGRVEDALRDTAGLAQFRRSDARSAHPTSQGITLRGLGGNASSRALLLLDGVPQADPFGGWVAFPAYLPERLAGVRVTRGGGSGYAGPGALAGTIELRSAGPADLDGLDATAAYGSRNSFDARGAAGIGNLLLAGEYARGDGFVPIVAEDRGPIDRASPYAQASLALRGVVPLGTTELQAGASAFRDRRDRGVPFTAIASDGADLSLRLVGKGEWRWSALGYAQFRRFSSGFASVNDARTVATATLDQDEVPAEGYGGRIEVQPPLGEGTTLRLGADARAVSGETRELFTYVAGAPTRRRIAGGRSTTFGAFADLSYESGPLTFSAGGRIDRWEITSGNLTERILATGATVTDTAFSDRRGTEATGRIGLAAKLTAVTTLRAAAYRGWRLPALNELYRPFRVGADATGANAALAPERLTGAEIGLDLAPADGLTLRATGYWSRLDDAIANVTIASGPGTFPGVGFVSAAGVYRQRRNLDTVEATGLEFDARYAAGEWSLGTSWSLADSRVRASGIAAPLDGLRPAQTARYQGSATVGWYRGGAGASLTARYVAPQFEDDQNLRLLAGAFTLDATVAAPLTRSLSVELRGENLTDARIEAGISSAGVVERATPRTLWIGLRYRSR
jgi:vitamin B12 transporter